MIRRGVGNYRRRGFGDVVSAGSFPVGSIGDQYQTCLGAGGDSASCAAAVIGVNPLATTGGASGSGAGLGTIALIAAGALFVGVLLSR